MLLEKLLSAFFGPKVETRPGIDPQTALSDPRNLRSEFKEVPTERIREILAGRRRNFAVLAVNIAGDLNLGNILRSHNAFLGSHLYYLGRRRYYRPAAVGTNHYEPVTYLENLEEARKVIPNDYTWVGIDNVPGAVPLHRFEWPSKPLIVLGNEQEGLDKIPNLAYHCQYLVEIPQIGSVRSLNVASAAAIAMYDLALQQGWLDQEFSR